MDEKQTQLMILENQEIILQALVSILDALGTRGMREVIILETLAFRIDATRQHINKASEKERR